MKTNTKDNLQLETFSDKHNIVKYSPLVVCVDVLCSSGPATKTYSFIVDFNFAFVCSLMTFKWRCAALYYTFISDPNLCVWVRIVGHSTRPLHQRELAVCICYIIKYEVRENNQLKAKNKNGSAIANDFHLFKQTLFWALVQYWGLFGRRGRPCSPVTKIFVHQIRIGDRRTNTNRCQYFNGTSYTLK